MEWQSISKREGKLSLRVGIHLGDVEHEEGPPPDVYGDTVNIAARLESIAEAGDVAISTSTYLCLDQNQAEPFKNCGKQTLKNIATPVEVWSTGNLNVGSKGMDRDSDKPAISVKPVTTNDQELVSFADEVTSALAKYLDKKDWIDSLIQKNPSEDDYQLIGSTSKSGPNFEINVILKANTCSPPWKDGKSAPPWPKNSLKPATEENNPLPHFACAPHSKKVPGTFSVFCLIWFFPPVKNYLG